MLCLGFCSRFHRMVLLLTSHPIFLQILLKGRDCGIRLLQWLKVGLSWLLHCLEGENEYCSSLCWSSAKMLGWVCLCLRCSAGAYVMWGEWRAWGRLAKSDGWRRVEGMSYFRRAVGQLSSLAWRCRPKKCSVWRMQITMPHLFLLQGQGC